MASGLSHIVFNDEFTIDDIDKEGRKFDRVSRLYAKSKNYEMDLTLDYNIELFPLKTGQTFTLSLATSLSRGSVPGKDGEGEDKEQQWRPDGKGQKGIEEDYEYVMFGKVYKFDTGKEVSTAYASFGGLLMSLTGSFRHMTNIILGESVYVLLRR
ncbi:RNA polymerase [Thelephora ganbajun]|uniref:RNA polymerase n=1 Tax=Thelephora ganbajun TaxID=370292 RepID=A0ACB6ZME5_THEGA|nr:RNA polymerase [Thelephora ganbajun]